MMKLQDKIKKLFVQDSDVLKVIEGIPQFSGLDRDEKKLFASVVYLRRFSNGEIIYMEESPSIAMYFIEFGSIGLFKAFENAIPERVQYIGQGRCVGYSALLGEQPRRSTAKALENCSVVALLRTDFLHILRHHPKTANKILLAVFSEVFDDLTNVQKEFLSLTVNLTKSNILI